MRTEQGDQLGIGRWDRLQATPEFPKTIMPVLLSPRKRICESMHRPLSRSMLRLVAIGRMAPIIATDQRSTGRRLLNSTPLLRRISKTLYGK